MSCIVLDIEFADENVIREFGVFIIENVQAYSIRPQKSSNPQSKKFGVQETCMESSGKEDVWITVSLTKFFLKI